MSLKKDRLKKQLKELENKKEETGSERHFYKLEKLIYSKRIEISLSN